MERPLVEAEAWQEFDEKGCSTALAIPLAFQIGVRLGELIAIKSSDISKNGEVRPHSADGPTPGTPAPG